jgi:hypothetical protein
MNYPASTSKAPRPFPTGGSPASSSTGNTCTRGRLLGAERCPRRDRAAWGEGRWKATPRRSKVGRSPHRFCTTERWRCSKAMGSSAASPGEAPLGRREGGATILDSLTAAIELSAVEPLAGEDDGFFVIEWNLAEEIVCTIDRVVLSGSISSMSVKRKVTVPVGAVTTKPPRCRGPGSREPAETARR